jgi:hypothetical protein
MISLGWITMPMFSQRVAPFLVMPTPGSAVTMSNASPSRYSGTARLASRCGGICDTSNNTPRASSMLRPWSTKRVP